MLKDLNWKIKTKDSCSFQKSKSQNWRSDFTLSYLRPFWSTTGFSPIKPEVDTLRVWDLDQTLLSRVFRVEWGDNHFCRTTSGSTGNDSSDRKSDFTRWKIVPDMWDTCFLCLAPRPLLSLPIEFLRFRKSQPEVEVETEKSAPGRLKTDPWSPNFKQWVPLYLVRGYSKNKVLCRKGCV